ncbi:MAG: UxaA family hydrolase [Rhodospirillales bacterium]|nr:UxaA family hydrolase [Rhodospirillales bacterium]
MSEADTKKAASDSRILIINDGDNVGVACTNLAAGTKVTAGQDEITVSADVELGHKIALAPLAAGDKIVKWGAPIGSVTEAVDAGDHVHLHNMQSDYIPTYTFDEGSRFLPGDET